MSAILLDRLAQEMERLNVQGLRRYRRTVQTACAPQVTVDGRQLLSFNSNDYLGLASDARIAEALQEGVRLYGAGSGASHLVCGHNKAHAQLEERLANFLGPHLLQPQAITFSTGYMANLAVLTALAAAGPGDAAIFSDALNHASLIDGARLARAAVTVYPHGDVAALAVALGDSVASIKMVVTDSVFSMDGDIAPLPALLALCEHHGAWLVVDDAHGFGVLGANGRGALEHFNLRSSHLVCMGTLGKAAGVSGAFVAAHATVIDWLVQRARPYIYTTAAPPALAHALLASVDLIEGAEGRQRRAHLERLRHQLAAIPVRDGWQHLMSDTPIQPLVIGGNADVLAAARSLEAQGLWVSAIRSPTVPQGTARLRITLSAAHTSQDVERLLCALTQLAQEA